MNYLAVLNTDNFEYICMSTSKIKAKTGVYNAFNIQIMKAIEKEYANPLVDTTSEWLASRLEKYYRHFLGGKIGLDTLENKFTLQVMEIEKDKVYRDGFEVPTREQDY